MIHRNVYTTSYNIEKRLLALSYLSVSSSVRLSARNNPAPTERIFSKTCR